ncbi:glycoside hydrolase family 27 protein [Sciscionella marina]|uniref:glycoside hydrolase family 27 protein n=1 Tax=Sciscionella marina TaxID=508770 RepID=UPI0003645534|nr:glycoside hydrolase family 27 protein [Sciscionella marina]
MTRARHRRAPAVLGLLLVLVFVVADGPVARMVDEGGRPLPASVAATPPMGWDSWNSAGCDTDERQVEAGADALVASGMRAAGYRYVVVDDCWFAPDRDASGRLRADPHRFPHGMRALGDYLHARGLRFGIYTTPGTMTCAQRKGWYPGATGSGGHERLDARTFADWGVDYLKYDWCSPSDDSGAQEAAFVRMRDALRATGRPIVYSINANSWVPGTVPGQSQDWRRVATMSRSTNDIGASWRTGQGPLGTQGIAEAAEQNAELAVRAGPGHWNDPDMLEVGVSGDLDATEQRSQFSLWAMMAAPLIAGNDLAGMPPAARSILVNRAVIAVDQDRLGRQAYRIRRGGTQVWVKPLADNRIAVALHNSGDHAARIDTTTSAVHAPGSSRYRVEDLWSRRTSWSEGTIAATVPAHGTVLLRIAAAGSS